MGRLSGFVSLHPCFKVPPDKMPFLKAILPALEAKADEIAVLVKTFLK
jgi:hypothetical protein